MPSLSFFVDCFVILLYLFCFPRLVIYSLLCSMTLNLVLALLMGWTELCLYFQLVYGKESVATVYSLWDVGDVYR